MFYVFENKFIFTVKNLFVDTNSLMNMDAKQIVTRMCNLPWIGGVGVACPAIMSLLKKESFQEETNHLYFLYTISSILQLSAF